MPDVALTTSDSLNTYDVLRPDKLVFTKSAFEKVEARRNRRKAKAVCLHTDLILMSPILRDFALNRLLPRSGLLGHVEDLTFAEKHGDANLGLSLCPYRFLIGMQMSISDSGLLLPLNRSS